MGPEARLVREAGNREDEAGPSVRERLIVGAKKFVVQFLLPAPVSRKGSFRVLSSICLRLLF